MQAQKMVIDFTNKTNQDSKITYKVGDYDKNGIDATLKGIDTAGLTAHLRVIDAEGTTQFTGAVSVAGDVANFRLPTTGPGTWFFELVAKNSNGEESSARYKYRLLETIGYDASVTIEYETLYITISTAFDGWKKEMDVFRGTNTTLTNTNTRALQLISEATAALNQVNQAIAAGTVDLELRELRRGYAKAVEHLNEIDNYLLASMENAHQINALKDVRVKAFRGNATIAKANNANTFYQDDAVITIAIPAQLNTDYFVAFSEISAKDANLVVFDKTNNTFKVRNLGSEACSFKFLLVREK